MFLMYSHNYSAIQKSHVQKHPLYLNQILLQKLLDKVRYCFCKILMKVLCTMQMVRCNKLLQADNLLYLLCHRNHHQYHYKFLLQTDLLLH